MAHIFFGLFFSLEHMPKVSTTVRAGYFYTPAACLRRQVFVYVACHGTLHFVVKTWPSTARFKFTVRLIERGTTFSTMVCSLIGILVQLSAKGGFSTFLFDNSFFFRCQGMRFCRFHPVRNRTWQYKDFRILYFITIYNFDFYVSYTIRSP